MILFPDLIPAPQIPEEDEKPVTKKNLMLRCVFSFILVIFLAIIATVVVLFSPLASYEPFNPNLEWYPLEVPNDLISKSPFNIPRKLKIPQGFGIEVYAQVSSARFLLSLPDDNVLVSQPKLGQITLLQPSSSFDRPATATIFASNLNLPQDMIFHTDQNGNQYIYVAENTRVARHLYRKGQKKIGFAEVVIDDLPHSSSYLHPYKGIAIGNGSLYISIGSSTDTSPQDLLHNPKRGAIYAYRLTDSQRRLVSQGIRHAEGIAFQPGTDNLWAASSQRTNIKYPYRDESDNYGQFDEEFARNNPVDEFIRIIEGENYAWPYCNPMPSDYIPLPYVADAENNPDEMVINCSLFKKVDIGLAPHSVPLGLTFWSGENAPTHYRGVAIVALHDNWNDGHRVIHLPFMSTKKPQFYKDLVVGWTVEGSTIKWGTPVDTAVLADGSLLISEDMHGAIYRLYKK